MQKVQYTDNPENETGTEIFLEPHTSNIGKVIVSYNPKNHVEGFKFYDTKGACLLTTGLFRNQMQEIILKADERIVGFSSRLHVAGQSLHNSLVVIIARRVPIKFEVRNESFPKLI